jgi:WD40 repeat protein
VGHLATGTAVAPFTGHTDAVDAIATAQPDGRTVVISGSDAKTVRVWDLTARTHS